MNSIDLCGLIKGMKLPAAIAEIEKAGCTARYTYLNGKNLVDNVTSDFVDTRLNLRVERDIVKHARIG